MPSVIKCSGESLSVSALCRQVLSVDAPLSHAPTPFPLRTAATSPHWAAHCRRIAPPHAERHEDVCLKALRCSPRRRKPCAALWSDLYCSLYSTVYRTLSYTTRYDVLYCFRAECVSVCVCVYLCVCVCVPARV